jgi:hypothetical protein
MPGGVLLLPVLVLLAGMLLEGDPTHMPRACVEVDPRLQYSDTRKACLREHPGSRRCRARSPGAGWC